MINITSGNTNQSSSVNNTSTNVSVSSNSSTNTGNTSEVIADVSDDNVSLSKAAHEQLLAKFLLDSDTFKSNFFQNTRCLNIFLKQICQKEIYRKNT
jgi:hypothetical protein